MYDDPFCKLVEWWREQVRRGSHELWYYRGDYLARAVFLLSCVGVLLIPVALYLLGLWLYDLAVLIWRAI